MSRMFSASPVLPALLLALTAGFLAGCSTTKPTAYQGEEFSDTSTFSHDFASSSSATCEAARRTLLSQGYIIKQAKADLVDGHKHFQPDQDTHVEIEFHVVCAPNDKDGKSSTLFVSATQDRYALKKTNNSASVGLSVLGSVSLPIGSTSDSLVKVASETIPAGRFYDRFFGLIEHYLGLDGGMPVVDFDDTPALPTKAAVKTEKE
ncbi:Lipoprotein [Collimonas arenae]|uniref:Lipoprotein n=1 Tax=Collimonas arenae TaxID=279058 RepID=A0A0A1FCH1_9BURK|nr:Lipoprotein [Collimonas arenae]